LVERSAVFVGAGKDAVRPMPHHGAGGDQMFGRDHVLLLLREGSTRDGVWIPTKFSDMVSMCLRELFVRCMHTLSIGAMATAANKDETRYGVVRRGFDMRPVGTETAQGRSAGYAVVKAIRCQLCHVKSQMMNNFNVRRRGKAVNGEL
jgi:hypothetical protein